MTPAEVLSIDDEYTAYCFNEACAVVMMHMDNGEEPVYRTHYSRFSDFYSQF